MCDRRGPSSPRTSCARSPAATTTSASPSPACAPRSTSGAPQLRFIRIHQSIRIHYTLV